MATGAASAGRPTGCGIPVPAARYRPAGGQMGTWLGHAPPSRDLPPRPLVACALLGCCCCARLGCGAEALCPEAAPGPRRRRPACFTAHLRPAGLRMPCRARRPAPAPVSDLGWRLRRSRCRAGIGCAGAAPTRRAAASPTRRLRREPPPPPPARDAPRCPLRSSPAVALLWLCSGLPCPHRALLCHTRRRCASLPAPSPRPDLP